MRGNELGIQIMLLPIAQPVPLAVMAPGLRLRPIGVAGAGFPSPAQDWDRPCKNAFAEPSPCFQDERIGSVFLISQVRIAAINGWTPKIAISLFIL